MRDDRERLRDMLDAIAAIKKYAARGRAAFDAEELVRTWIIHHLLLRHRQGDRLVGRRRRLGNAGTTDSPLAW